MAFDGTVNDNITDSVTQVMAHMVGNAPAETKGMLDTLMAETVGMAMYNAVTNQHNAQMVGNASVIAACARMLKAPVAVSPAKAVGAPTIAGIMPATVPVTEAQLIQIIGSNFSTSNVVVRIFDSEQHLLAMLSGSAQLAGPITAVSISFTYTFTQDGVYSLQVENADGTRSNKCTVKVGPVPPTVASIHQSGQRSFHVRGAHFHPNLAFSLEDDRGQPISGATIADRRPDGFTLTLPPNVDSQMCKLAVTNPGHPAVSRLFQAAPSVVVPSTVEEAASDPASPSSTIFGPCQPPEAS